MTAAAGVTMAAILLTGCLGTTPEPTPTPTAVFASEEEAFAAAEETYRGYIEAVNSRWADPSSEPDPQSFLVEIALEEDIASANEMDQVGISVVGSSVVTEVSPVAANEIAGDVVIRACLDSSGTKIVNEIGEDVTLADRDPTVLAEIHFTTVETELRIREILGIASETC